MDKQGYPFYIRIYGLTQEIISFHGNFCKSIWITYPCFEIQVIKNWRPVAKVKKPIALFKERQRIIDNARSRLTNIPEEWDEIPF